MTHCSEDDLILHYYGELPSQRDLTQHLDTCAECAAAYQAIADTMRLVAIPDVPGRGDAYGREVWQQIRARLPERPAPWWQLWFGWRALAAGVALAAMVAAAFVAGRSWQAQRPTAVQAAASAIDAAAGDRVRLAAIGDHLERSERMLLDLVNADGDQVDLSAQQMWAADLIDSNRLYRDAASFAGDNLVAGVLDDLERSLLEIVHGPSMPTRAELDGVRARLDAAALLFKVRVLADELHERETESEAAPIPSRKTI